MKTSILDCIILAFYIHFLSIHHSFTLSPLSLSPFDWCDATFTQMVIVSFIQSFIDTRMHLSLIDDEWSSTVGWEREIDIS